MWGTTNANQFWVTNWIRQQGKSERLRVFCLSDQAPSVADAYTVLAVLRACSCSDSPGSRHHLVKSVAKLAEIILLIRDSSLASYAFIVDWIINKPRQSIELECVE